MTSIVLVSVLALIQYFFFGMLVGRARRRYGVAAPAVTGNEMFERYYRVQTNTLEQLVIFLPALWFATLFVRPVWPVVLGIIYLIGRLVYWRGYVRSPEKRGPGFGLTALPNMILLAIGLVGSIVTLVRGG